MKIKTKLTLGVGMLFAMIILLALLGTVYINALKKDTENILVDNYNTLEYSRNMLLALDESQHNPAALQLFRDNLAGQLLNITEPGEREATTSLDRHFKALQQNLTDSSLRPQIRRDISQVMQLNMSAIKRKSVVAGNTAASATLWIVSVGTLCFLFAFVLLVNLPGNIAEPLRELTERIRSIAAQNYSQRVTFGSNNEFRELASSFNTMAEKLQEYHSSNLSSLLMEKKRIETLINNMKDPVIGLDEHQQVLFANQEALSILSLKSNDLVGKNAVEIAERNDLIRSLIQPQGTAGKEPVKIYADQKESYFQKEIIPIGITPTGEQTRLQIGNVIILKNITPFKELDFAKTNFIATVSHELKTPIASVKMSLQLLKNKNTGPVNDEQRQLIESIEEDSNRLLKITGELLNMTQVETGNIQMNIQESRPADIVHYAMDAVAFHAEQKNIRLELYTGEDLPLVKADPEKTSWVMINFLTNAIRYSREHGQVTVTVRQEDTGKVLFSVQDNGKGIDPRYTGRIFDRYFQVPGSSRSGTGLGLAISKEFIEAQGGSVGVESEIGRGSRFYFRL